MLAKATLFLMALALAPLSQSAPTPQFLTSFSADLLATAHLKTLGKTVHGTGSFDISVVADGAVRTNLVWNLTALTGVADDLRASSSVTALAGARGPSVATYARGGIAGDGPVACTLTKTTNESPFNGAVFDGIVMDPVSGGVGYQFSNVTMAGSAAPTTYVADAMTRAPQQFSLAAADGSITTLQFANVRQFDAPAGFFSRPEAVPCAPGFGVRARSLAEDPAAAAHAAAVQLAEAVAGLLRA